LQAFSQSERALVTNARCLTEGVDIPGIDCVLFADPKTSTVDVVQATGRALRLSEGKQRGYVVIPVLLNMEEQGSVDDQNGRFSVVIQTLRALAANDERIIEYFRSISKGQAPHSAGDIVEIALPLGRKIDADRFKRSVELQPWSSLARLDWRPFEEAREFARSLHLRSRSEWDSYCHGELPEKGVKPLDIPVSPNAKYKVDGWEGWGDWLDTGNVAPRDKQYRPFAEAREFARSLKLTGQKQWQEYCAGKYPDKTVRPSDIPTNPQQVYADTGWISWGDWLGTGNVASGGIEYRPYAEAREFTRSLKLKNSAEWARFCKGEFPEKGTKPKDIPAAPWEVYKDKGWTTLDDWLGTGNIAPWNIQFREFAAAREFARSLNLNSRSEWDSYCHGELPEKGVRPLDIPVCPDSKYKDHGWAGWSDFLGTDNIAPGGIEYRPFAEAREFARSLNLKDKAEWTKFSKGEFPKKGIKPRDIPANPAWVYRDTGWINWKDWLGNTFLPFEEARAFARKLELTNKRQWTAFCQGKLPEKGTLPKDIPAGPYSVYKDKGWAGFPDWLGTETSESALPLPPIVSELCERAGTEAVRIKDIQDVIRVYLQCRIERKWKNARIAAELGLTPSAIGYWFKRPDFLKWKEEQGNT